MAYTGKTQFAQSAPSAQPGFLNSTYSEQGVLGNVLYVSSILGSSAGPGWTPETAFATVAQALAQCVDGNGDKIVLLPGHNEGIGNAQLTWNKAGVWIEGRGQGAGIPRFDFDHANASIDITASGIRVTNIRLLPSVTGVAIGIDVNAAVTDTILEDIEVLPGEDGAGVDEFVLVIDLKAGCDRTKILRLKVRQHASAAHANAGISLTGASDDVLIDRADIVLKGGAGVAPIKGITTLSTNVRILNSILVSDDEPGIELLTGTTGVIRDNVIFTNLATVAAAIVADGCALFNNEYVEVGGERGALIGTASADD